MLIWAMIELVVVGLETRCISGPVQLHHGTGSGFYSNQCVTLHWICSPAIQMQLYPAGPIRNIDHKSTNDVIRAHIWVLRGGGADSWNTGVGLKQWLG